MVLKFSFYREMVSTTKPCGITFQMKFTRVQRILNKEAKFFLEVLLILACKEIKRIKFNLHLSFINGIFQK